MGVSATKIFVSRVEGQDFEAKYIFPKCDGANCSKKSFFGRLIRKSQFFSQDFIISFSFFPVLYIDAY